MDLIYCAGGGRKWMKIAREERWLPGARSDHRVTDDHRPLFMLDVDWKKPDWAMHLAVAKAEWPALCVIPDVLALEDLAIALDRAEEAAPYCEHPIIVPKCACIQSVPRVIGGREIRLGYSVPSSYGSAGIDAGLFDGWPVHLLGGTPRDWARCREFMDVRSADGNVFHLNAMYGDAWRFGKWAEFGVQRDAEKCFRESLRNAMLEMAGTPPQGVLA